MISNRVTALMIQQVWERGHTVPGLNKDSWREDDYGNLLCRSDYGNSSSIYGWKFTGRLRPIRLVDHHVMLTVRMRVA